MQLSQNIMKNTRMLGKDFKQLLHMQGNILLDCFECIKTNSFEKFDALVTDTNCQIRTLNIVSMFHNEIQYKGIMEEMQILSQKLKDHQRQWSKMDSTFDNLFIFDVKNETVLKTYIHLNDITISESLNILLLCRMTTITRRKNKNYKEETAPNQLYTGEGEGKKYLINPSKFTQNYIKEYISFIQSKITEQGVHYLRSCFDRIKSTYDDKYQCDLVAKALLNENILSISTTFVDGHNTKCQVVKIGSEKQCISCFYGTQIIIQAIQFEKIPVILIVHCKQMERRLIFGVDSSSFKMHVLQQSQLSDFSQKETHTKPIFVVEAECNEIIDDMEQYCSNLISQFTLDQILREEAAQHPQFAGHQKDVKMDDQQLQSNIDYFAKQAHEHGFSKSNPKLLLIQHIYPSVKY